MGANDVSINGYQGFDTNPNQAAALTGSRAVALAAAAETVITETARAIDMIREGTDLLGSSVLRLASMDLPVGAGVR
jgi:hypothetical protein